MRTYYLNGKFIPVNKALIQVDDLGFTRACGVFEFLRTYGLKPFELTAHLERLKKSARKVALFFPWKIDQLKKIVLELIEKNKIKNAGIRLIITPGLAKEPGSLQAVGSPTIVICFDPIKSYPKKFYQRGISLLTTHQRRIFPGAKTTNYLPAFSVFKQAKKQNYQDILFLDEQNNILEASTSSFFIIKDNKLITPKERILSGITRKIVLDIASACFLVEERKISLNELKIADEAFISSTTKEIMPVTKIDKIIIGNGEVGKKTKKLAKLFKDYFREESKN